MEKLLLDQGTMDDMQPTLVTVWEIYPRIEDLPRFNSNWKADSRVWKDGVTRWTVYYASVGTNDQYLCIARDPHTLDVMVWCETWPCLR